MSKTRWRQFGRLRHACCVSQQPIVPPVQVNSISGLMPKRRVETCLLGGIYMKYDMAAVRIRLQPQDQHHLTLTYLVRRKFEKMSAVRLLQADVDETEESHFRFLVHEKTVKYVTIPSGLFAVDDLCFAPTLLSLLPEFPDGDWNHAYIDRTTGDGPPRFVRTIERQLPTIESRWHPNLIDHLELSFGQKLRSGVYEAVSSGFPRPVVAKFARFEWEIPALDRECMAYRWIEGKGLGPKFLGHLSEDGRINGFVMERITGARHATPDDLVLCQVALSKLHDLGILHGDVNRHNFLIKDDQAILIDFECARMSEDKSAFLEEIKSLPDQLGDMSGRGGSIVH